MARYDHLPIYRGAFDLAVHLEQIVRHFDRYHKYTLGTDLRTGSRRILERIIDQGPHGRHAPPRTGHTSKVLSLSLLLTLPLSRFAFQALFGLSTLVVLDQ